MNSIENRIIYDLETGGLDIYNAPILQFTARDGNSGQVIINEYVWPHEGGIIEIESSNIHGITDSFLQNKNAITVNQLCALILRTIRHMFGRQSIVWVAYNNFKFDQLIFEISFKRANMRMPDYWYFMDLLPLIRDKFRIEPDFKLSSVYNKLIASTDANNTPIKFHDALDDTYCLYKVFLMCVYIFESELHRFIRPKLDSHSIHDTTLGMTLPGYHPNLQFENLGYATIGDLYKQYCKLNCNIDCFKQLLTRLNVSQNFRIRQITEHMQIMKHINAL